MTAKTEPITSEIRDGMCVEWDVPIPMDDGIVLRADVYRPVDQDTHPALITYGPYAKGLAFQDGYPSAWERMAGEHPDVAAGSSNKYQNWEVVDPEKWVPDGYACVRVDSRGTGRSPGYVDHFSPRETEDFYAAIEWAAAQDWCDGKVGLNGVSYYGMNQWQVASRNPPHLAAMCVWEGAADWYRDATHHGGVLSTFWANWYDMQVKTVQHGLGERGPVNPNTGDLVCGPETLDEEALAANRTDFGEEILVHPLDDSYHRERSPQWDRIAVPLLSAGNWGGQGLHLRGNVEGFIRAASSQKWLEMHGIEHWTHFYTDYGVALQKRFFGHFLKGERTGWDDQPPVLLQIRHVDGTFHERAEHEWPIARTRWTRMHLHGDGSLSETADGVSHTLCYEALGDGVTFTSPPLESETELTGPSTLSLSLSSSTTDADVFAVLRVFDPDDREVTFQGAIDPHTPVGQGWLRASHRKLDPELSTEFRPYHTHDERQPLTPGEAVELKVEILPTSILVPAGYRIALTIRGSDYVYAGGHTGARLSNFKNELTGCGPFLHDDPRDRPADVFGGTVTLHIGGSRENSVLLPVVAPRRELR